MNPTWKHSLEWMARLQLQFIEIFESLLISFNQNKNRHKNILKTNYGEHIQFSFSHLHRDTTLKCFFSLCVSLYVTWRITRSVNETVYTRYTYTHDTLVCVLIELFACYEHVKTKRLPCETSKFIIYQTHKQFLVVFIHCTGCTSLYRKHTRERKKNRTIPMNMWREY